jgi:hypothetical protein
MSWFFTRSWLGVVSLLLCGVLANATHAHAAEGDYRLGTQGEVLDDRVMYTIGGGSAVSSPSSLYRPSGLGVGGSWRANMMCGNMSLTNTLQNQLNGVTEGFQQIMGSVVQNATQGRENGGQGRSSQLGRAGQEPRNARQPGANRR